MEVWRKFKDNKLAMLGFYIILLIILASILADFSYYDPNQINLNFGGIPQAPSLDHPLGVDNFGRDYLIRLFYGGRVSILVGIGAVLIYLFIGASLGAISGYFGGIIDLLVMRLVDLLLCLPTFFFILVIQSLFKPSLYNVILVIGLTSWAGVARLVRAQVLSLKEQAFIEAARALGFTNRRIIFKHLLPNALSPIIVSGTLGLASVILTESVLSFLGFGVQPPTPSWGNMLQNAQEYILSAPYLALSPGILIMLAVLAFNFIGDGLRDALDPKMKI